MRSPTHQCVPISTFEAKDCFSQILYQQYATEGDGNFVLFSFLPLVTKIWQMHKLVSWQ
jgi:hypothetical protein